VGIETTIVGVETEVREEMTKALSGGDSNNKGEAKEEIQILQPDGRTTEEEELSIIAILWYPKLTEKRNAHF
jgi:hypothetical protein